MLFCVNGLKTVPFSEFSNVFDIDLIFSWSCVSTDFFVFLLKFNHFTLVQVYLLIAAILISSMLRENKREIAQFIHYWKIYVQFFIG